MGEGPLAGYGGALPPPPGRLVVRVPYGLHRVLGPGGRVLYIYYLHIILVLVDFERSPLWNIIPSSLYLGQSRVLVCARARRAVDWTDVTDEAGLACNGTGARSRRPVWEAVCVVCV